MLEVVNIENRQTDKTDDKKPNSDLEDENLVVAQHGTCIGFVEQHPLNRYCVSQTTSTVPNIDDLVAARHEHSCDMNHVVSDDEVNPDNQLRECGERELRIMGDNLPASRTQLKNELNDYNGAARIFSDQPKWESGNPNGTRSSVFGASTKISDIVRKPFYRFLSPTQLWEFPNLDLFFDRIVIVYLTANDTSKRIRQYILTIARRIVHRLQPGEGSQTSLHRFVTEAVLCGRSVFPLFAGLNASWRKTNIYLEPAVNVIRNRENLNASILVYVGYLSRLLLCWTCLIANNCGSAFMKWRNMWPLNHFAEIIQKRPITSSTEFCTHNDNSSLQNMNRYARRNQPLSRITNLLYWISGLYVDGEQFKNYSEDLRPLSAQEQKHEYKVSKNCGKNSDFKEGSLDTFDAIADQNSSLLSHSTVACQTNNGNNQQLEEELNMCLLKVLRNDKDHIQNDVHLSNAASTQGPYQTAAQLSGNRNKRRDYTSGQCITSHDSSKKDEPDWVAKESSTSDNNFAKRLGNFEELPTKELSSEDKNQYHQCKGNDLPSSESYKSRVILDSNGGETAHMTQLLQHTLPAICRGNKTVASYSRVIGLSTQSSNSMMPCSSEILVLRGKIQNPVRPDGAIVDDSQEKLQKRSPGVHASARSSSDSVTSFSHTRTEPIKLWKKKESVNGLVFKLKQQETLKDVIAGKRHRLSRKSDDFVDGHSFYVAEGNVRYGSSQSASEAGTVASDLEDNRRKRLSSRKSSSAWSRCRSGQLVHHPLSTLSLYEVIGLQESQHSVQPTMKVFLDLDASNVLYSTSAAISSRGRRLPPTKSTYDNRNPVQITPCRINSYRRQFRLSCLSDAPECISEEHGIDRHKGARGNLHSLRVGVPVNEEKPVNTINLSGPGRFTGGRVHMGPRADSKPGLGGLNRIIMDFQRTTSSCTPQRRGHMGKSEIGRRVRSSSVIHSMYSDGRSLRNSSEKRQSADEMRGSNEAIPAPASIKESLSSKLLFNLPINSISFLPAAGVKLIPTNEPPDNCHFDLKASRSAPSVAILDAPDQLRDNRTSSVYFRSDTDKAVMPVIEKSRFSLLQHPAELNEYAPTMQNFEALYTGLRQHSGTCVEFVDSGKPLDDPSGKGAHETKYKYSQTPGKIGHNSPTLVHRESIQDVRRSGHQDVLKSEGCLTEIEKIPRGTGVGHSFVSIRKNSFTSCYDNTLKQSLHGLEADNTTQSEIGKSVNEIVRRKRPSMHGNSSRNLVNLDVGVSGTEFPAVYEKKHSDTSLRFNASILGRQMGNQWVVTDGVCAPHENRTAINSQVSLKSNSLPIKKDSPKQHGLRSLREFEYECDSKRGGSARESTERHVLFDEAAFSTSVPGGFINLDKSLSHSDAEIPGINSTSSPTCEAGGNRMQDPSVTFKSGHFKGLTGRNTFSAIDTRFPTSVERNTGRRASQMHSAEHGLDTQDKRKTKTVVGSSTSHIKAQSVKQNVTRGMDNSGSSPVDIPSGSGSREPNQNRPTSSPSSTPVIFDPTMPGPTPPPPFGTPYPGMGSYSYPFFTPFNAEIGVWIAHQLPLPFYPSMPCNMMGSRDPWVAQANAGARLNSQQPGGVSSPVEYGELRPGSVGPTGSMECMVRMTQGGYPMTGTADGFDRIPQTTVPLMYTSTHGGFYYPPYGPPTCGSPVTDPRINQYTSVYSYVRLVPPEMRMPTGSLGLPEYCVKERQAQLQRKLKELMEKPYESLSPEERKLMNDIIFDLGNASLNRDPEDQLKIKELLSKPYESLSKEERQKLAQLLDTTSPINEPQTIQEKKAQMSALLSRPYESLSPEEKQTMKKLIAELSTREGLSDPKDEALLNSLLSRPPESLSEEEKRRLMELLNQDAGANGMSNDEKRARLNFLMDKPLESLNPEEHRLLLDLIAEFEKSNLMEDMEDQTMLNALLAKPLDTLSAGEKQKLQRLLTKQADAQKRTVRKASKTGLSEQDRTKPKGLFDKRDPELQKSKKKMKDQLKELCSKPYESLTDEEKKTMECLMEELGKYRSNRSTKDQAELERLLSRPYESLNPEEQKLLADLLDDSSEAHQKLDILLSRPFESLTDVEKQMLQQSLTALAPHVKYRTTSMELLLAQLTAKPLDALTQQEKELLCHLKRIPGKPPKDGFRPFRTASMEAELNALFSRSYDQLTPKEQKRLLELLRETQPVPPEGTKRTASMEVKLAYLLSKPYDELTDEEKQLLSYLNNIPQSLPDEVRVRTRPDQEIIKELISLPCSTLTQAEKETLTDLLVNTQPSKVLLDFYKNAGFSRRTSNMEAQLRQLRSRPYEGLSEDDKNLLEYLSRLLPEVLERTPSLEEKFYWLVSQPLNELSSEDLKLLEEMKVLFCDEAYSTRPRRTHSQEAKLAWLLAQPSNLLNEEQRREMHYLLTLNGPSDDTAYNPAAAFGGNLYRTPSMEELLAKLSAASFDDLTPSEKEQLIAIARLPPVSVAEAIKAPSEGWPWVLKIVPPFDSPAHTRAFHEFSSAASEHFSNYGYACQTDYERYPPFIPYPSQALYFPGGLTPNGPQIRFWPWSMGTYRETLRGALDRSMPGFSNTFEPLSDPHGMSELEKKAEKRGQRRAYSASSSEQNQSKTGSHSTNNAETHNNVSNEFGSADNKISQLVLDISRRLRSTSDKYKDEVEERKQTEQ